MKKIISLERSTSLNYSDIVIHGDLAFICGQMSLDLETDQPIHGTIEEETQRTLENLEAVLGKIGCTRDDVLSVTAYMMHDEDFPLYDKTYGAFFKKNFPVRSTVTVAQLYDNLRVEICAIAAVHSDK